MHISDEAIEAAAKAVQYALQTGEGVHDIALAAIEAAAPYIMAYALNETAENWGNTSGAASLRARADSYLRGGE